MYSTISFDTRVKGMLPFFSGGHKQLTERKIMAKIYQCSFCGGNYIGTCECILRFGQNLQKRVICWLIEHTNKSMDSLPPFILKAFNDERWELYRNYLKKKVYRAGRLHRASIHASKFREKLQKIADKDMEKFDSDFQVLVSVNCSETPRC